MPPSPPRTGLHGGGGVLHLTHHGSPGRVRPDSAAAPGRGAPPRDAASPPLPPSPTEAAAWRKRARRESLAGDIVVVEPPRKELEASPTSEVAPGERRWGPGVVGLARLSSREIRMDPPVKAGALLLQQPSGALRLGAKVGRHRRGTRDRGQQGLFPEEGGGRPAGPGAAWGRARDPTNIHKRASGSSCCTIAAETKHPSVQRSIPQALEALDGCPTPARGRGSCSRLALGLFSLPALARNGKGAPAEQ